MESLRVIVIGPLTVVILVVFLIVERVRPAQRRPLLARGYRQDLLYTVLNATLTVPLVTALTLSFADVVDRSLPWLVLARIGTVPSWGAIAVIFVAMDGCNWFAHLANHRVRMLWRFHELHHSQEDMNVLTVFRTHPFIHVSYLIALVPGIVLVANGALPTTLLVVYGGVVAFAHSNTNLGFGPLERVFVSPNYHRIHHQLDGPQDVNLGFALTIWDQMFNRAVFPTPETIRTDTGLPGRPLIVEQSGQRPRHLVGLCRSARRTVPAHGREGATAAGLGAASRRSRALPCRGARDAGVTASPATYRLRSRELLATVLGTRTAPLPADLALIAARTALAWIFIYHGSGKLFGWFNGPGVHRTAVYFANTAHLHPGEFFAVLGGVTEFGSGIALALGLASRLAGIALFGDMVMAMITVSWANGINSETPTPGYELNMALGVLALVVAFFGAGRFSIDALIERRVAATATATRTEVVPSS